MPPPPFAAFRPRAARRSRYAALPAVRLRPPARTLVSDWRHRRRQFCRSHPARRGLADSLDEAGGRWSGAFEFPPGWLSRATMPLATGSLPEKTIGVAPARALA